MIDSKLKDTVIDLDICAMAKKMGQSQQKVSLSILHAEKKASFVCKEIELRKKTERGQHRRNRATINEIAKVAEGANFQGGGARISQNSEQFWSNTYPT
jgi:hypothetical protein